MRSYVNFIETYMLRYRNERKILSIAFITAELMIKKDTFKFSLIYRSLMRSKLQTIEYWVL